jgi:hypothetical protein
MRFHATVRFVTLHCVSMKINANINAWPLQGNGTRMECKPGMHKMRWRNCMQSF